MDFEKIYFQLCFPLFWLKTRPYLGIRFLSFLFNSFLSFSLLLAFSFSFIFKDSFPVGVDKFADLRICSLISFLVLLLLIYLIYLLGSDLELALIGLSLAPRI